MKKDLKYLIPFWGLILIDRDVSYIVGELDGPDSAGIIIASFSTTMLAGMGIMWLLFDVILK